MSEIRKKQVLTYLAGHHMEKAPIPDLQWNEGTSSLKIKQGTKSYTINLARFFSDTEYSINGKKLTVNPNANFSDVVKQISKMNEKSEHASIFSLIEPYAYADSGSDSFFEADSPLA